MGRKKTITRFNFGKYNGRDIEEIRFKDPNYFDWAYRTIERFRDLVDSLDPADKRPRRPARATAETHGLVVAAYNPDHVTAEGWSSDRPCLVIEDYKRRLRDEPLLPWLHPRHMCLDPSFDPAEKTSDIPW